MEFLLFLLIVCVVIYLPGRYLLRFSKFDKFDFVQLVPLSLAMGLASFLLFTYLLSWVKLEILYNVFPALAVIFEGKKSLSEFTRNFSIKKFLCVETLLIFVGSTAMVYLTYRSGVVDKGAMVFYGANARDGIYHLSLIGNLYNNFPPTHPGLAGLPLHGYNFFYDFLIANFMKFYHFDIYNLFFRYFPIMISLLYGMSYVALGRFFHFKRIALIALIYLAYFSQGFQFIFDKVHIVYDTGIIQPLGNIVDPSVILSVSLLFLFSMLLFSTKNIVQVLLASILLSVLPMLKIYTGIVVFGGLGIIALTALVKERTAIYAKILIVSAVIALITYVPTNLGSGHLIFAPFLLYTHFLQSYSDINHYYLRDELVILSQHNNYIKIAYRYLFALFLFFIPTLGIRSVGLFSIKKILKKDFYSNRNLFFLSTCIIGIFIPSFFIQSIAVFVILQFFWITYFVLLIPAAFSYQALSLKINKSIFTIFSVLLIGIGLPDMITLINGYSSDPHSVDVNLLDQATFIKYNTSNKGIIVLDIEQKDYGMTQVPIVSALSSKSVYMEPELMEFSGIDKETEKRKSVINEIRTTLAFCEDKNSTDRKIVSVMSVTNSEYILTMNTHDCLNNLNHLKEIHQSGDYILYKLKSV